MLHVEDTIAAVSSPPGRSLRGLIRLTGPGTRAALSAIVAEADAAGLFATPRHLAPVRLQIRNPSASTAGSAAESEIRNPNEPCSSHQKSEISNQKFPRKFPILAACFAAPRSYTAQDLVELQLPGNPALLDRVMHTLLENGARLAEPGEFTFRAFVAARLDLTQAEGVAATIAATSDSQLQAATLLRRGALGRLSHALVDELATQLALVEAGIDFVDQEDVVPIEPAALAANLATIAARLHEVLSRSRSWGSLEGLPRVVLVGPPSSGKSTLFNALLGRKRAVISPLPGTTRDILTEPMTLPGRAGATVEIMLVDVAGLDDARSALDEQVQHAARQAIEQADLILAINDGRDDPAMAAHRLRNTSAATGADATPTLRVRSKIDCPGALRRALEPDELPVSAAQGRGLDELRRAIAQGIGACGVSLSAEMMALQPRHESALRRAAGQLDAARRLLAPQRDRHGIDQVELVAGALRLALDELACLGGQMSPDEVIGRVFATFCVGK